ncbi:MAG: 3-isopropylmalate dehydratase small subunit [Planctomycetota bacterium]|nr:3-isopropylmalate dehydratase small subunit [Planctomycetota bacterium]
MKLKGKAWKFGANVDTDGIIAGRYCATQDPVELAKHLMEDIAPTFRNEVQKGDIIVGGSNFGCGSSREQAPMAIRGAGVSAVIAESFARIFFRNSINIGLPILESAEAYQGIESGDEIEIDLEKGEVRNLSKNTTFSAAAYPKNIRDIIAKGGLLESILDK